MSKAYASDISPPYSSASPNPALPDGLNGWYLQTVGVDVSSIDEQSGIASINWRINGGNWFTKTFSDTLNLVINPSFEDDLGTDWVFSGTGIGEKTNAEFLDGSYSVSISSVQNGYNNWSNKNRYLVVSPWDRVNVSVFLKTDSVAGIGAFFKVYALTSSGDLYLGESDKITGTNDWRILSSSFIVSNDSAYGVYIELAFDGSGKAFFDSVYGAATQEEIKASFTVTSEGVNLVEYYAVDNAGNSESVQNMEIKIDSRPPSNWRNFETERAGNDHELITRIEVSDAESGLSKIDADYQYTVTAGIFWGHYDDPSSCSGAFNIGSWLGLDTSSYTEGSSTGVLETDMIDFCNSIWLLCKGVRFKVFDVAGNNSTNDVCINGPWFKTTGGDIYAKGDIFMTGEVQEDTSEFMVVSEGSINNVTSSKNWVFDNYAGSYDAPSFGDFEDIPDNVVTVGSFPDTDGAYRYNGNLSIGRNTIPNSLKTSAHNVLLFINGDLTINRDIDIYDSGALLMIVNGNVDISRRARVVEAFIVSYGQFDSLYDWGFIIDQLEFFGGLYAQRIHLDRYLLGQNKDKPSEIFYFSPKYILNFRDLLGKRKITFKEIK